jgi:hypothetical protein
MTSGLQSGSTAREIEMMQVRTAAQTAQGDAVAASMARSADRSLEEQHQDRILQTAREERAIKREMRERMKWERVSSANNVRKVSASDMSSWQTNEGGIRVERNVPDPFILSLIEEERQIAAREAAEGKKRGFSPLGASASVIGAPVSATKKALSFNPFRGGRDSGRDAEPAEVNPASAEPQFVRTSSGASAPSPQPAVATSATVTKPGMIPRISGAELVDGSSRVNPGRSAPPVGNFQPSSQGPAVQQPSFATGMPEAEKEKSGFFSKRKPSGGTQSPSSGSGGGLFSFGKKKNTKSEPATIDASLFPSGAVAQSPTGGNLGGAYTSQDVAQDAAVAPSSTGNVELPGTTTEKRSRGFSLPKPSLSIPSLSSSGGSSGGGSVPTRTTINSAGTDYYVVASTAQFMVYGEDQMQSEVRALTAGTVVRMTKPGDTWAGVRLPDGTEGIVQNKSLRPASMAQSGSQFAPSN